MISNYIIVAIFSALAYYNIEANPWLSVLDGIVIGLYLSTIMRSYNGSKS